MVGCNLNELCAVGWSYAQICRADPQLRLGNIGRKPSPVTQTQVWRHPMGVVAADEEAL